ncbi:SCO3242 family prenyltransferase [Streptomyces sp. NPDC005865]|uniref:SCO3242 family prenyltransferase n=1 Tax=Streptomyces sp. NPDC005865 TaxID=3155453 RepID=UPI00340AE316
MNAPRAWAELLRLPALFTVPGDALAGAATTGLRPNRRTLLAIGSSLCLYEAGMALNDWADRADDAVERPERPLPSGRITPPAALAAATAFTAAGLTLAARAGRPSLVTASALAGTVWAYDLGLKHTPAGPAAMAAARGLDLLLGVTATAGRDPSHTAEIALPSAAALAAHTLAVTVVSRREAQGGSSTAPLAALAVTAALTRLVGAGHRGGRDDRGGHVGHVSRGDEFGHGDPAAGTAQPSNAAPRTARQSPRSGGHLGPGDEFGHADPATGSAQPSNAALPAARQALRRGGQVGWGNGFGHADPTTSTAQPSSGALPAARQALRREGQVGWGSRFGQGAPATGSAQPSSAAPRTARQALRGALALAYFGTAAKPLFHAVLNPSPPLTQRAVSGGIRAMIPLQAALTARAGAAGTALLTAALAPAARQFARKVSVT